MRHAVRSGLGQTLLVWGCVEAKQLRLVMLGFKLFFETGVQRLRRKGWMYKIVWCCSCMENEESQCHTWALLTRDERVF